MSAIPEALPAGYALRTTLATPALSSFVIETDGGVLSSYFTPLVGEYVIRRADVLQAKRAIGIGRQLITIAYDHARSLQAKTVVASLTSRESVEVTRRVFGDTAVIVSELGDFAPPGMDTCPGSPTTASLYKEL